MPPVRLMIIDTSPVNAGGAQLLLRYAKYFDPARVRPTVVLHEENVWAERHRASGRADVIVEPRLFQSAAFPGIHEVPMRTWARGMTTAIRRMTGPLARLAREVRARDIDVLMGISETPSAVAALLGAALGRPAVLHPVSTYVNRFLPAAMTAFGRLPSTHAVITLSEYTARSLPRLRGKVTAVYSGIDLEDFARPIRGSLRAPRGIAADRPLVGIAGRFVDIKGMDVFARAAARVARDVPDALFYMLGDDRGEYGDSVHALVRDLGLEDRMTFTGFVDDMHAALADLDVVVVPSRRECAPLVVYESMALGKPVVASDVHGIPELVEAGRTGLLAPVDDDAAFARAIVELLRDPTKRAGMGERAKQRVHESFNVAAATRQIEQIVCDAAAAGAYPWARRPRAHREAS